MTKRYLKTPEEVIQVLQEGKTVEDDNYKYRLVRGVICSLEKKEEQQGRSEWAVGEIIYKNGEPYVAEPEPLKLEVDKFYKTRDGRKAWITECTDLKGAFPFRVATQRECSTYVITKDGRRYFEDTDGTDLVAPWEE